MATLIWFLQHNLWVFWLLVFVVSTCIGSFLNVVIHRLPLMMHREMMLDYQDFSEGSDLKIPDEISLAYPPSSCPACHTPINYRDNIPLVGWILLKGRCRGCGTPISAQYPMVEFLTGILGLVIATKYGVSYQTLALLALTYALITLTFIDFKHHLLPDRIVYPLAVLGLCANSFHLFVPANTAIWGLAIGFLLLWSVLYVFKKLTGKDGMGYGDLKLLACLGAWFGFLAIPNILFIASILGVIVGLWLRYKHGQSMPYAFGPYLAAGGWIVGVLFY